MDYNQYFQNLSTNPMFNMGLGLLQASGPSLMPTSFGQAAARGMQSAQEATQRAAQARMLKMQADRYGMQNQAIQGALGSVFGQDGMAGGDFAAQQPQAQSQQQATQQPPMQDQQQAAGSPGMPSPMTASQPAPAQGGVNPLASQMVRDPVARLQFAMDPSAFSSAYLNRAYPQPTNIEKLVAARRAVPDGSQIAKTLDLAIANEAGAIQNVRQGGMVTNMLTGQAIENPKLAEGQALIDPMNPAAGSYVVPGTYDALEGQSAAQAAGKARYNVMSGVDPRTHQPVYTTAYDVANGAQQGGQPGAQAIIDQMNAKLKKGIPQADVEAWGRVQMQDAGLNPQPVAPSNPAGYGTGQDALAKSNAADFDKLKQTAMDSPMRMNVMDNILELSRSGVQTGPGSEWQNSVLGTAANIPGLRDVLAGQQDKVAKFQELEKFMRQNGLRAWQAAGGSGTDAQLEAALKANPNDKQFPQALQKITEWNKAGELAVMAKANAQQAWFDGPGNRDLTQRDKFEAQWRQHFDPLVFQLQTMTPEEAAKKIQGLSKADAQRLIQSREYMKPYLQVTQ